MTEWSLVLFSVAIQLSCGLAMAAAFADSKGERAAAMRPVGMGIFPRPWPGPLCVAVHLWRIRSRGSRRFATWDVRR